MSLSDQINNQYTNRKVDAKVYGNTPYVRAVQKEVKSGINTLLKLYFPTFTHLSLLEIGAGNGTNAFMFESLGFQIKNIAFNELLKERIDAIRTNFPDNVLFEGDATKLDTSEKYDVIFQSTVFTSILNDTNRVQLAAKMWDLLKPGGVILWYDFIYNNPKNPDVKKVTFNEVKTLFTHSISISKLSVTLAPPIGRKVGKFYRLFNFPFLRSHILVVLQKNKNVKAT